MILIITHKLDFTADYVINKLNERGIAYRRFNCEDILDSDCSIKFDTEFSYTLCGECEFKSVWFRRTMLPDLDIKVTSQKAYILSEIDSLIHNLFSIIDANWISSPDAIYKAENKLYQLKIAKAIGFTIPETLVTTSKKELLDFYNLHKNIIVKPIEQTRIDGGGEAEFIYTSKVTEKQILKLADFDLTPCIFQREIEKSVELRITIVGEQTFCAQIDSQQFEESKTDWRKRKIAFTSFDLPTHIHELCVCLVKSLRLKFGAIDMTLSPDGEYTFLEINPNGQWVWIETETGLRISDALINELL